MAWDSSPCPEVPIKPLAEDVTATNHGHLPLFHRSHGSNDRGRLLGNV
jgi:hypothetical protein